MTWPIAETPLAETPIADTPPAGPRHTGQGWQTVAAVCALIVAWAMPSVVEAFYILSPRSEACHERLMLGSLQAAEPPFGGTSVSTARLLERFAARIESHGVPADEGTRALIDEIAKRYGLEARSEAERFVLASFVAGVREPDTDGLSVVKFNETRSLHLQDENQPLHALRMSGHDDEAGDAQAIAEARKVVVDRVRSALVSWRSQAQIIGIKRWSFSFYGEVDVSVFDPAFQLGRASHVVQDAFAHALRDDHMRITAVGNFVDALQERYHEPRDGPSHSDRLDECDAENDAFDEMRVAEARDATAALLVAATALFADANQPIKKHLDAVLDEVFALQPGCTYDNEYCGSEWAAISNSDLTEPYDLTFCSSDANAAKSGAPGSLLLAALASLLVAWRLIRSRAGQVSRSSSHFLTGGGS